MPSPVDKYFKEVKDSNPSYSDEQAWATAWSIYCKHKNPNSEHCHKDSDEYLKGKSAGVVVRVASRFKEALDLSPEIEQAAKAARNVGELLQQMIDTAHEGGDANYAQPIAEQLSRILGMYKHNVMVMAKAIDTIPKGKEQQRAKALVKELEKVFSKSFEYKWEGARWLNPSTTEKALKKLTPLVDELEKLLSGQRVLFKGASLVQRIAERFKTATEVTQEELAILSIMDGIKPSYRSKDMEHARLGEYGPNNPHIQSLIDKGLVKLQGGKSLVLDKAKAVKVMKEHPIPDKYRGSLTNPHLQFKRREE